MWGWGAKPSGEHSFGEGTSKDPPLMVSALPENKTTMFLTGDVRSWGIGSSHSPVREIRELFGEIRELIILIVGELPVFSTGRGSVGKLSVGGCTYKLHRRA